MFTLKTCLHLELTFKPRRDSAFPPKACWHRSASLSPRCRGQQSVRIRVSHVERIVATLTARAAKRPPHRQVPKRVRLVYQCVEPDTPPGQYGSAAASTARASGHDGVASSWSFHNNSADSLPHARPRSSVPDGDRARLQKIRCDSATVVSSGCPIDLP